MKKNIVHLDKQALRPPINSEQEFNCRSIYFEFFNASMIRSILKPFRGSMSTTCFEMTKLFRKRLIRMLGSCANIHRMV